LRPSAPFRLLAPALVCTALAVSAGPASALSPGDPDPTFGANGVVYYSLGLGPAAAARLDAVALQPDGKLVVAGRATDADGRDTALVARLNADGSLDPSFGDGGKIMPQLGSGDTPSSAAHALALQPDGKILVGGESLGSPSNGFMLARLNSNGSFDSDFGDHGKVFADLPSDGPDDPVVSALALQPDGKILAGGTAIFSESTHSTNEVMVARVNGSNGSFDGSFGNAGIVLKQLAPPAISQHSQVYALALDPGGQIVVAGSIDPSFPDPMVIRLSGADGKFDSSFGDGGLTTYRPYPDGDSGGDLLGMAVTPGGDVIAGGWAFGQFVVGTPAVVVRLGGAGGVLDPAFGDGGQAFEFVGSGPSPSAQINALALQPDGRVLVGGFATDRNGNHMSLIGRLDGSTGSPDPSFASGGQGLRQLDSGTAPSSEFNAIALQPDGNVVAAGLAGSRVVVARLMGASTSGGGPSDGSGGGGGGGGNGTLRVPENLVATLSKLGISPATFAAAPSGPSIAKAVGARVAYENTQAATTMLTVLKRTRGVRHKGRCVKPSRHRHGKSCARWVAVGRFTHADEVGLNSFHFTGRVYGHKLRPGRCRLRARPRFAGPAGTAIEVSFRIVK
jgi:uncharacterized delta-60 repeat protein